MGVVPFDDHPGVLGELGRLEDFEERLGQARDQTRLELRSEAAFEQLDAYEWHLSSPRAASPRQARARDRVSCPARGRAAPVRALPSRCRRPPQTASYAVRR